jgi:Zn-dependent protease
LIALAGPLSNLILAFLALLGGKLLVSLDPVFSHLVIKFAFTAVFLALFNCLPFPWLDGWIIVRNLFNVPSAFMEQTSIWWYLGLLLFLNFTPFQMVLIGWADSIVVRMGMLVGF